MQRIIFILFFVLIPFYSEAQKGKMFPELRGVTIDNKSITIPEDTKGKYTLVGIAFSQKSQEILETWADPVYHQFIEPSGLTMMVYDVNLYLTLMFTGVKHAVSEKAIEKIKEGTDADLDKHVLIYEGKMGKYDNILKMKDKKTAYFFVLDKEGNIAYATSGPYSERKMDEIGDIIEE